MPKFLAAAGPLFLQLKTLISIPRSIKSLEIFTGSDELLSIIRISLGMNSTF
jgi:hypothetical protein